MTHGKVSTIARFGIEAGKGEQKVRQEAEAQATARQQAAINAQAQASALRASTDISKTILNAQARQEAEAFESFMQGETAKRSIAWEQEKIELRNMHDFDMLEQRRDVENQLKMADDQREKTKLNSKIAALDAAVERGDITEDQAQQEKLRLEIGVPGSLSPLFKKTTGKDALAEEFAASLRERGTATDVIPEQKNSAKLLEISSSGTTSTEDRIKIKEVVAKGDPVEIKVTLDVMEAKKELEKMTTSFGGLLSEFVGQISPIATEIREEKIRGLQKTIGLPITTKRKRKAVPSFDQTFRQTMGSFR